MTPMYALRRLQLASEEGAARRPKPRQGSDAGIVGRAFKQAVLKLEEDALRNEGMRAGGERTGMFQVRLVFYRREYFTDRYIDQLAQRFRDMPGVTVERRFFPTRRYKKPKADELWFIVTWPEPAATTAIDHPH